MGTSFGRRTARRGLDVRPVALVFVLAAGTLPAGAEEWHEAYRAGVRALARSDYQRAVKEIEHAIALRPEPGRNVVTYGTNVEARYYPYLRLSEAWLGLGEVERAQAALTESAARGIEPPEERRRLEARVESALSARRAAQTPSPSPSTPPSQPPPPTTLSPAAAPPPTSAPSADTPTTGLAPEPVVAASEPAARTRRPPPASMPAPEETAPRRNEPEEPAAVGTVEILSEPAGAHAYLDDEPLGSTDPESGRLVKTSVPPGRHRVRVEKPGFEEIVREIEVSAGAAATFYARMARRPEGRSRVTPALLAFGAVAAALVAVVAWMILRRPEGRSPIWTATPWPRGSGRTPVATPPGEVSPGAREDDLGQQWFGDYRLLDLLGRGGMASVFKAEKGGETVALKRPLASLLVDSDFVERFRREAEIGRTLNHPNIVRIVARGDVEGVPFFTMELLDGQTLQAFLRTWGAAPARAAAGIVAQVAEALDLAHGKGVVHRDLKPSNIMLLHDQTAKVMDFGIARARRFEGITTTGSFLGTPEYVAPEVIEGGGAEPRSDLYALGAVFYELLTGRRPFTGDTPFAVLKKHCTEELQPPSAVHPGIPPEIDAVVGRLLAKTPGERPDSAEELVVTLRDWLNRAS